MKVQRFHHIVDVLATENPHDTAIESGNDALTYQELKLRSDVIAQKIEQRVRETNFSTIAKEPSIRYLVAINVRKTSPDFLPLLTAVSRTGGTACFCTYAHDGCHPDRLAAYVGRNDKIRSKVDFILGADFLEGIEDQPIDGDNVESQICDGARNGNSSIFCLLFTGGTVQEKVVSVTHAMFCHEFRSYRNIVPSKLMEVPEQRIQSGAILCDTSLYWAASCLGQISIALALRIRCVFLDSDVLEDKIQAIEKHKISFLGEAPMLLSQMIMTGKQTLTTHVQLAFTWGEKLGDRVIGQLLECNIEIRELLIATEYWLCLYRNPTRNLDTAMTDLSSRYFYVVSSDIEVVVVESDTDALVEDMMIRGALSMRGDHVSPGYFDLDSMEMIPQTSEYLCTSDLVELPRNSAGEVIDKVSGATRVSSFRFLGRDDLRVKLQGEWLDLNVCLEKINGEFREFLIEDAQIIPIRRDGRLDQFNEIEYHIIVPVRPAPPEREQDLEEEEKPGKATEAELNCEQPKVISAHQIATIQRMIPNVAGVAEGFDIKVHFFRDPLPRRYDSTKVDRTRLRNIFYSPVSSWPFAPEDGYEKSSKVEYVRFISDAVLWTLFFLSVAIFLELLIFLCDGNMGEPSKWNDGPFLWAVLFKLMVLLLIKFPFVYLGITLAVIHPLENNLALWKERHHYDRKEIEALTDIVGRWNLAKFLPSLWIMSVIFGSPATTHYDGSVLIDRSPQSLAQMVFTMFRMHITGLFGRSRFQTIGATMAVLGSVALSDCISILDPSTRLYFFLGVCILTGVWSISDRQDTRCINSRQARLVANQSQVEALGNQPSVVGCVMHLGVFMLFLEILPVNVFAVFMWCLVGYAFLFVGRELRQSRRHTIFIESVIAWIYVFYCSFGPSVTEDCGRRYAVLWGYVSVFLSWCFPGSNGSSSGQSRHKAVGKSDERGVADEQFIRCCICTEMYYSVPLASFYTGVSKNEVLFSQPAVDVCPDCVPDAMTSSIELDQAGEVRVQWHRQKILQKRNQRLNISPNFDANSWTQRNRSEVGCWNVEDDDYWLDSYEIGDDADSAIKANESQGVAAVGIFNAVEIEKFSAVRGEESKGEGPEGPMHDVENASKESVPEVSVEGSMKSQLTESTSCDESIGEKQQLRSRSSSEISSNSTDSSSGSESSKADNSDSSSSEGSGGSTSGSSSDEDAPRLVRPLIRRRLDSAKAAEKRMIQGKYCTAEFEKWMFQHQGDGNLNRMHTMKDEVDYDREEFEEYWLKKKNWEQLYIHSSQVNFSPARTTDKAYSPSRCFMLPDENCDADLAQRVIHIVIQVVGLAESTHNSGSALPDRGLDVEDSLGIWLTMPFTADSMQSQNLANRFRHDLGIRVLAYRIQSCVTLGDLCSLVQSGEALKIVNPESAKRSTPETDNHRFPKRLQDRIGRSRSVWTVPNHFKPMSYWTFSSFGAGMNKERMEVAFRKVVSKHEMLRVSMTPGSLGVLGLLAKTSPVYCLSLPIIRREGLLGWMKLIAPDICDCLYNALREVVVLCHLLFVMFFRCFLEESCISCCIGPHEHVVLTSSLRSLVRFPNAEIRLDFMKGVECYLQEWTWMLVSLLAWEIAAWMVVSGSYVSLQILPTFRSLSSYSVFSFWMFEWFQIIVGSFIWVMVFLSKLVFQLGVFHEIRKSVYLMIWDCSGWQILGRNLAVGLCSICQSDVFRKLLLHMGWAWRFCWPKVKIQDSKSIYGVSDESYSQINDPVHLKPLVQFFQCDGFSDVRQFMASALDNVHNERPCQVRVFEIPGDHIINSNWKFHHSGRGFRDRKVGWSKSIPPISNVDVVFRGVQHSLSMNEDCSISDEKGFAIWQISQESWVAIRQLVKDKKISKEGVDKLSIVGSKNEDVEEWPEKSTVNEEVGGAKCSHPNLSNSPGVGTSTQAETSSRGHVLILVIFKGDREKVLAGRLVNFGSPAFVASPVDCPAFWYIEPPGSSGGSHGTWLRLENRERMVMYQVKRHLLDRIATWKDVQKFEATLIPQDPRTIGTKKEVSRKTNKNWVTFVSVRCLHACGDAHTFNPVIADLLTFYGDPQTCVAEPNYFSIDVLENRLSRAFDVIDPEEEMCLHSFKDIPIRHSLRGRCFVSERSIGLTHVLCLGFNALTNMRSLSQNYNISMEELLFGILLVAEARTSNKVCLSYTMFVPQRESWEDTSGVGLYADFKDMTFYIPRSHSTIVGVVLDVANKVRKREWKQHNPINIIYNTVVNVYRNDTYPAGGRPAGLNFYPHENFKIPSTAPGGKPHGRRITDIAESVDKRFGIQIREHTSNEWAIYLRHAHFDTKSESSPNLWMRKFVRSFQDVLWDLQHQPWRSVHETFDDDTSIRYLEPWKDKSSIHWQEFQRSLTNRR